ncbi:MAG TPA: hypothetical protein VFV67_31165 [Actinophytocola sp.]|uniref:hypothetical protein n=1 Tax=Actinophytocola sp. TaxID=1872138 RepID=UPI002DB72BB6|nr:hypothetical protein [Actinophytocola sp.]HEU5475128.1 hypothetical protein [Actinophytocola sp.]
MTEPQSRSPVRRGVLLGVLGALLVVGVAVPLLRTESDPSAAPAPPPPPVETERPPVETGQPVETFTPSSWLGPIDFADERHGFALRGTCYDVRTPCPTELMMTEDGEHWRAREVPARKASGPRAAIDRLWVLGGQEVIIGESYPTPDPQRWHSADAGQTWRPIPSVVTGGVPAVPTGGLLELVCPRPYGLPYPCEAATPVVTLPGTGELAELTNRPPLELKDARQVPVTADGNLWVSGLLPGTERWAVAASADAGRTWSVTELADLDRMPVTSVEVSVGGDTVFAIARAEIDILRAISVSTDGGRSWRQTRQTWMNSDGRQPLSITGEPIATTDGRLIINARLEEAFVSTDQGASFQPTDAPRLVRWTRAGYLAGPDPSSEVFRMSWNGVDWREFTIG